MSIACNSERGPLSPVTSMLARVGDAPVRCFLTAHASGGASSGGEGSGGARDVVATAADDEVVAIDYAVVSKDCSVAICA